MPESFGHSTDVQVIILSGDDIGLASINDRSDLFRDRVFDQFTEGGLDRPGSIARIKSLLGNESDGFGLD